MNLWLIVDILDWMGDDNEYCLQGYQMSSSRHIEIGIFWIGGLVYREEMTMRGAVGLPDYGGGGSSGCWVSMFHGGSS